MAELKELIQIYCRNMDLQAELDNSLLKSAGREEWVQALHKRSDAYETINAENNRIIGEVIELLAGPCTLEQAKEYSEIAREMYRNAHDELELMVPLLEKALEKIEDVNEKQKLLYQLYFEECFVRASRLDVGYDNEALLRRTLDFEEVYEQLEHSNRIDFWNLRYNYVIMCLEEEEPDVELAYRRLKEVLDFWNTPVVQELDGADEEIVLTVRGIIACWFGIAERFDQASEEIRSYFCELADRLYSDEARKVIEDEYSNEIYVAHLDSMLLRGKISYTDAVRSYYNYCDLRLREINLDDNTDANEFDFMVVASATLERWCRDIEDEEYKKTVIRTLKKVTKRTLYNQKIHGLDSWVDSKIRKWCFTMMKYMKNQAEKVDWIVELVVRRQLPTYLHSDMVRKISEAIGREVMRQQPEYFDELPEELSGNIIEYIRTAALLHDIGKTNIIGVITTQGRRLSDAEFAAIKRHPQCGYEILKSDSDLSVYADIAIGHHKYFDGNGGYPPTFDNNASPYKFIIDIITLADCMDAATDYLGRNYKRAKTFEQVLEEFKAGRGTQYSALLVDIIDASERLKNELSYIVGEGRVNTMYMAYLENAI